MIVECDVLAILVKSYDKEDFKIYLLKVTYREWHH
ncbi:Uncharacterized protein STN4L_00650 [Streptococcus thermophilus]|nr:hypothetical protein STH8232_1114 [Streptococcus thermophilus JIM 8232]SSC62606.1 Uncharacterized protein STN4L_00650 [Streptococcus thermophilus]